MNNSTANHLLASIENSQLIILCGAGVSVSAPSSVPLARDLLGQCIARYNEIMAVDVPAAAKASLEEFSEYVLFTPTYRALFLERLVDWTPFHGTPNPGHIAIADFLACGILEAGVTTNFDVLIEEAGEDLGEELFDAAIDGAGVNYARPHKPLLKLHGCMRKSRNDILWCKQQLTREPREQIATRIDSSGTWLRANLSGRDLLIVGFWTDWAYLNSVLETALHGIVPAAVFLTDPNDEAHLQAKAPGLWGIAAGCAQFVRIPQSGSEFLDELRKEYSLRFFSRVLAAASQAYTARYGVAPPQGLLPNDADTTELYQLRKDLFATPSVVRGKDPNNAMEVAGVIHLRLQAKGAVFSGSHYSHRGRRVRVINGGGQVLSLVKKRFSARRAQSAVNETIICAGAEDDGGVPSNLVREGTLPTVIRPESGGEWLTTAGAEAFLA